MHPAKPRLDGAFETQCMRFIVGKMQAEGFDCALQFKIVWAVVKERTCFVPCGDAFADRGVVRGWSQGRHHGRVVFFKSNNKGDRKRKKRNMSMRN